MHAIHNNGYGYMALVFVQIQVTLTITSQNMEAGEAYWTLWWIETTFVEKYSWYCGHISNLRGYYHTGYWLPEKADTVSELKSCMHAWRKINKLDGY